MRLTLTNTNLSAIDRLSISLKVDEAEIDEFKRNHCLDYSDEKPKITVLQVLLFLLYNRKCGSVTFSHTRYSNSHSYNGSQPFNYWFSVGMIFSLQRIFGGNSLAAAAGVAAEAAAVGV